MNVALIYAEDCPNVASARANLLKAFVEAGVTPRWSEYVLGDPATPADAIGFGSPTILVEGRDVAGGERSSDACCRVYPDQGRILGAPSVAQIAESLRSGASQPAVSRSPWRGFAVLPGIGSALLPKVACPACWPAYAGFLSSLGLGFLMKEAWLLPLTAVFLTLAVSVLAYRARRRRGFGPFALGIAAALVVLVGKFRFERDDMMFVGIGLLIAASLWNSWPRKQEKACPACETTT
jgi:hypothetical protein